MCMGYGEQWRIWYKFKKLTESAGIPRVLYGVGEMLGQLQMMSKTWNMRE